MNDLVSLLAKGCRLGASDIVLAAGSRPMAKANGQLIALPETEPLSNEACRALIYSGIYESARAKFENDWELDYSFAVQGLSRFRVNVMNQRTGISAVYRVIPGRIPTMEQLGLTSAMSQLADLPRGLVLVTGPTGSGKSTTLAAIIETINKRHQKNILTIEDPIEFVYESAQSLVLQREVGSHTKSFNEALRRALRQAPDVILIGEMRDLETIQLAITAAETGHLCFGTLHTQDCASTIDRIIDVFPPQQQQQVRAQLSLTLKAVISQMLLPRKDGQGRAAVREFMAMTPAVANLIRENKAHMIYSAIETGQKFGMQSMDQHLAFLVQRGVISLEDAAQKARDRQSLQNLLQMMGGTPKQ